MRGIATGIALFLSFLACSPASSVATEQPGSSSPSELAAVYKPFLGSWTGVLEYRDFSSDARVQLPTWLDIKLTPDARSLQFAYTYDDGPNKTVKEFSTVTIDLVAKRYTMTLDRDHSSDTYQTDGLDKFLAAGHGALVLTGAGVENEKRVDVRISLTLGRNLYRFIKETRLPGKDFQFRDGYTLTRSEPLRATTP